MNRRVRTQRKGSEGFNKYLKPGALAQLRDSKISARSQKLIHRVSSVLSSLQSSSTQNVSSNIQIETVEHLPKFPSLIYGPQCFGRKKLAAAKNSVYFVNFNASDPASESNDSFINVVNSDLLVH
ncbi:hypothetical protein Nepgr_007587 [Nepenthes gracilis]|uniref:Uncharacterized protein n=1 Tax=Nepenthes gracilis TaxID=150966 RepID=A0AAD3S826_NEPGR|nr:hypothetical protein Nepgr_007587 [Nepenthes gracilis]